jgi:hypothetical protein
MAADVGVEMAGDWWWNGLKDWCSCE